MGKSIIIEMDANTKLGKEYIPNDPHKMSPNGTLLAGVIDIHALFVANGSAKSKGTITRRRATRERVEESVIDLVLFSNDMNEYFVALTVDEEKKHGLKRIRKTKNGIKIKESDHNVLVTEFNCNMKDQAQKEKLEIFNLKNNESQKKFKEYTLKENILSGIFDQDDSVDKLTEKFIKKLNGCIAQNFRKIRINGHKKNKCETLYQKLRMV